MDHPVYMSSHLRLRHAHTLPPYQQDKRAVHRLSAGLQSSILCSPLQRHRYSVIAVHNGLFQNASTTMHIKKSHIFHSLIYQIPIFTRPKSFAGYCNCVQSGITWIILQNLCWQADIRLTGKETSQLNQNLKARYHVHRKPLLTDYYELIENLPRWQAAIRLTGEELTNWHRTQRLITVFTETRHTTQSSVTRIQPNLQEPRVLKIHFHITFPTTSIVIKITVHLVVCGHMT